MSVQGLGQLPNHNNATNDGGDADNSVFKNPKVAKAIGKLKEKLRNAERRTGDMNKEIYQFCTLPYFQNIKNNNLISELYSGGKTNKRNFTYPHPAYGWFQQVVNHYLVNWVIHTYNNDMQFPLDRSIDNYRRKYGVPLRRWWVKRRNDVISEVNKYLNNMGVNFIGTKPVLTTAVNLAMRYKRSAQNGMSINMFDPNTVAQIKRMLNDFSTNNTNIQVANSASSSSSSSSSIDSS